MTSPNSITPIQDPSEIRSIRVGLDKLVVVAPPSRDPANPTTRDMDLIVSSIAERRWVAVPVESSDHFDEEQAESLALAMRSINIPYTIAYSAWAEVTEVGFFRVPSTKESLLELSSLWWWGEFVLAPPTHEFIICCTKRDYYVVAGDVSFVELAVGTDIATARKEWHDFAMGFINHGGPSVEMGEERLRVGKCYEFLRESP